MSTPLPPLVDAFLNEVTRKHAPKTQIKKKSESWINRAISWLLKPINPNYLTGYTTTYGSTIWIPDNFFEVVSEKEQLDVIAHETQHIIDTKKLTPILYSLAYGFPQNLACLATLAAGSPWNPWMWFWLLALLFVLPLPAPGRYLIERTGYRTGLLFCKYVYKYSPAEMDQIYEFLEDQLSGRWYYFAWPFRKSVRKALRDENFMKEERYQEILKFLERHNLVSTTPTP